MKKIKFIPIFFLLFMALGCSTTKKQTKEYNKIPIEISQELVSDINTVDLIAIVLLEEGKVAGNWPVKTKGAEVKEEIVLEKRIYTRAEIQLRGKVLRILKGSFTDKLLHFNIPMFNILADRNKHVIEKPGSNFPDLIIGDEYLIMKKEAGSKDLYYNCIWPSNSSEANGIHKYIDNHLPK